MPAAGAWTVHRDDHADDHAAWTADWSDDEPDPAPATTVAWLLWHEVGEFPRVAEGRAVAEAWTRGRTGA